VVTVEFEIQVAAPFERLAAITWFIWLQAI